MTKRCKDCVARIFGVCRGDFCAPERVGLCEQAERQAQAHGHVLAPFEKEEELPIWYARCIHCGRTVAYTLDPGPGESAVYGDALEVDCEVASVEEPSTPKQ